jgi:hypothetical protein
MDFMTKVLAALGGAIAVGAAGWLIARTQKTRWFASLRARAGPKGAKFFRDWGAFLGLALGLSVMAAYLYIENQPDHEAAADARNRFAAMSLPVALAYCLALPNEVRYEAPLAFAWQPQALDWYVLEGADNAAMRHYTCDGVDVTKGKRYARVMLKRVALDGTRLRAGMEQNLFDRYAVFSDTDVRALEVAEDPQTGKIVERRWLASGSAQLSDALAKELPVLLDHVPAGLAVVPYPQRTPQVPSDWSEQADAVFVLLGKHVQPGQRIGQLYFAQKEIRITVVGPVSVPGQPPASFGVLSFDAYGVADQEAWAPTLVDSNTCRQGRTLSELKALWAQAPRPQNMLYAWFDCDPTQAHGNLGAWYLRDVRTRKEQLPPGRH